MSQPFDLCRIQLGAPLRRALESLSLSGLAIVLVEDAHGRVVGTMTDGDIRRALLAGNTLESRIDDHIARDFAFVGSAASRAEVLDLMQSRRLSQIPILDADSRVIGIHTLHGILGAAPRSNWAVIMAGGRGERLRPLADSIPKPMIHVAGRPILERIVLHLVGCGIQSIFLAVNYKADIIERHFGNGSRFGCAIDYLREDTPMGSGGALSLLPAMPDEPILVLHGDLLTQVDVGSLLDFHARGRHQITIGIREYTHTIPFGVVTVADGRLVRMREKPTEAWLTNAGIYVIEPPVVARVPREGNYPMPSLVEDCLDRGESIGAFPIENDWIDVGRHAELRRARGLD